MKMNDALVIELLERFSFSINLFDLVSVLEHFSDVHIFDSHFLSRLLVHSFVDLTKTSFPKNLSHCEVIEISRVIKISSCLSEHWNYLEEQYSRHRSPTTCKHHLRTN